MPAESHLAGPDGVAPRIILLPMAQRPSSDPFLRQFFERLPEELHTDFTNRQLAAMKAVFGDATHSGHAFDLRLNVPLARRSYYVVLLGGRDRRGGQKRRGGARRGLAKLGNLIVGGLLILQVALAITAILVWIVAD